jgi:uncharacterized damage-inducible protein DinB
MSTIQLLTSLFNYKAWSNNELFGALRLLPESALELYPIVRTLNHIYVADSIFVANLQGITHSYTATNTPETPGIADLHVAVQTTDRWYIQYIESISQEKLLEQIEFSFVDGDMGKMSRQEMLMHVITHGSYHRGAVGKLMAQAGIAPPRDIYTRFLQETDPVRRLRN